MSRTKRQRIEHQGELNYWDKQLVERMKRNPQYQYTTADICRITGCASARDKIRKLQAAGVKIGPAKLLRVNENGTRVYGWRVGK